jgi:hypothetical protein
VDLFFQGDHLIPALGADFIDDHEIAGGIVYPEERHQES